MENQGCKTCESCRYFKQHYVRTAGNRYTAIDRGHCVHPRLKDRTVQTPACQRYCGRERSKQKGNAGSG